MLVLTRKKMQSILLGEDIEIQILEVKGEQVRIGIKAPASLRILRKEIYAEGNDQKQDVESLTSEKPEKNKKKL